MNNYHHNLFVNINICTICTIVHRLLVCSTLYHTYYDTNIIISDCLAKKLKVKLQRTINEIMLWVKSNKLTINFDKTHCMSFRNDIEFEIEIENELLVQVSETKFLGLIIDNSLNWKSHFQFLKNKLLKIYWIIKNVSFCLNESAMIKLYYALLLSPFNVLFRNLWAYI